MFATVWCGVLYVCVLCKSRECKVSPSSLLDVVICICVAQLLARAEMRNDGGKMWPKYCDMKNGVSSQPGNWGVC